MEISGPKIKVMVVSAVPALAVAFICNGNPVEQVATFKYLGISFPSVRLYRALCHANQVEGWWFLGGCSTASFISPVWQYHQPAFAFVASYPGACLTVWVSDLGYA